MTPLVVAVAMIDATVVVLVTDVARLELPSYSPRAAWVDMPSCLLEAEVWWMGLSKMDSMLVKWFLHPCVSVKYNMYLEMKEKEMINKTDGWP